MVCSIRMRAGIYATSFADAAGWERVADVISQMPTRWFDVNRKRGAQRVRWMRAPGPWVWTMLKRAAECEMVTSISELGQGFTISGQYPTSPFPFAIPAAFASPVFFPRESRGRAMR